MLKGTENLSLILRYQTFDVLKGFGKSMCYNTTQIQITQLNTQSFPQHINYIEIRSNINFSNTYNIAKIEQAHIISI